MSDLWELELDMERGRERERVEHHRCWCWNWQPSLQPEVIPSVAIGLLSAADADQRERNRVDEGET